MLVVTCESCNQKYKIDETKMKNAQAKLKCKSCDHYIIVKKPSFDQQQREEPEFRLSSEPSGTKEPSFFDADGSAGQFTPERETSPSTSWSSHAPKDDVPTTVDVPREKRQGLGLKGQLFVYLFVPFLVIFMAAILVSMWQLANLVKSMQNESSAIVSRMAELSIADNSRSVAKQMRMYLDNHPEVTREQFHTNKEVRKIALQLVGYSGYTAITSNENGMVRTWLHVNDKLIGHDLIEAAHKLLGKDYEGIKQVMEATANGKENQGYYLWKDEDGQLRQKFLVATPIPGTNLFVDSTTYIEEFTRPNQLLINKMEKYKARAQLLQTMGVAVLSLLIAALVFIYGRNLTNRITNLSEVVDRISLGELEIEIQNKAKDEIGQLSESISRMQDSLRLSIDRLRKRRKSLH